MEYIILCISVVAIICVLCCRYKKATLVQKNETEYLTDVSEEKNEGIIRIEALPSDAMEGNALMSEITDRKLLAHIDQMIPGLMQAGSTVYHSAQASKQTLYQVIIPKGVQLSKSGDMKGAFRGFFHGKKGIKGHANLKPVDQSRAMAVNAAASIMGVASMIVGQYYMAQVDAELSQITSEISKISDFQNNEYKSKVCALIEQMKRITAFQTEILENQELRTLEIINLNSLEQNCIELLGQANEALTKLIKKEPLNYKQYTDILLELQEWFIYQSILSEALRKMSELKFILHLGKASKEQCTMLFSSYAKKTEEVRQLLTSWHERMIERLEIEPEHSRRKRSGMDKLIHWIPGMINDDINFRSVSDLTIALIEEQTSEGQTDKKMIEDDVFNQDVQLIIKDGKVYYLPSQTEENQ